MSKIVFDNYLTHIRLRAEDLFQSGTVSFEKLKNLLGRTSDQTVFEWTQKQKELKDKVRLDVSLKRELTITFSKEDLLCCLYRLERESKAGFVEPKNTGSL